MLQKVNGDKTLKTTAINKWYARSLDGQESIRDEKRTGCPKIAQRQIMSP